MVSAFRVYRQSEPLQVGRRVLLREPRARDRTEFLDAVWDSRELHHPWVEPPDTEELYDVWLRRGRSAANQRCLVCRRDDGRLLGYVGLNDIVRGAFQSAYLGYYAFSHAVGHGYMTEALRLTLRHVFRVMKLHRVEANIQPQNAHSIALVERCGFNKEGFSPRYLKIRGRWRDHERWALTVESWVPGPRP